MAEIFELSNIDASNIGRWPEGMLGGQINNAGRADEGILARWYNDTNSAVTASGSSNAFAITSFRTISLLFNNLTMAFTANHTITGAATLNLNGLGAKDILRFNGTALGAGDIVSGQPCWVIYKSAVDDWFLISNPAALFANMHADFNENASPGNPAANVARLYAFDDGGGTTLLAWRDSAGNLSVLRQATAANMEAASVNSLVPANLQHRHPGHPKAWGFVASDGTLNTNYGVASVGAPSSSVYTVTLATAMSSSNYAVIANITHDGVINRGLVTRILSTTQFQVSTYNSVNNDPTNVGFSFMVLGDV